MTPETQHPTTLTDEQRQALRDSDPAAFDDDDGLQQGAPLDDDAPATPAATPAADPADPADPAPAAAAAAAAPAAKPEDGQRPNMVPEPRLAEVVAERNTWRERALELERREQERAAQQAAAAPPRDFDAEISALDQAWEDNDFEGSFREYQQQRDALIVDKAREDTLQTVRQQQEQQATQAAQQAWDAALKGFLADEAHAVYNDDKVRVAALNAALVEIAESQPDLDHATLLRQAHADVVRRFAPAGAPAPVAVRNGHDARQASQASQTPPLLHGGVGSRGGPDSTPDLSTIKPGKFSTLPKHEQERLLGEGAL